MINDFLGIAIVGVALSLAIEFLKGKYGTDSSSTKALAVGGAVLVGSVYWFLSSTVYWQTILGVLGAASTVYALFFSGKNV